MTCAVCGLAGEVTAFGDREIGVHPGCLGAGILQEAVQAFAELLAAALAPVVIVWAG